MAVFFGLLVGTVGGFLYNCVLFLAGPPFWYGYAKPTWSTIAIVFALQALPFVVGLLSGVELVRQRRVAFGWFLISTGISSFAPAAACDVGLLLRMPH